MPDTRLKIKTSKPMDKLSSLKMIQQRMNLSVKGAKSGCCIFLCALVFLLIMNSTVSAESLTIACYKDYKPFSYVNSQGEAVGILVDIWRLWAKENHITLQFVPNDLGQSLELVKKGEADIIIGLFHSDKRAEYLDFSESMLEFQTNLYVAKNRVKELKIDSAKEIGDTIVGVIEKDAAVEYLRKEYPKIRLKLFPGSMQIVQEAMAGKLKAYVLDSPNQFFFIAEYDSLLEFRNVQTLYSGKLRAGVQKGNQRMLEFVRGVHQVISKEGDTIYKKWSIPAQPLILRYRTLIVWTIILLLAVSIGFLFYSMLLKSRVKRLKSDSRSFEKDDWLSIIDQGENEFTEFKSSIRWNLKTQKTDKGLEYVIVKTISAFMNAKGGLLFIGVSDQGELLGIDPDYKTFQKKPNQDGFMLKFSSLINQHLGRQNHKFVSLDIHSFEGTDICRVTIHPGEKPVFIKENGKEAFYIRAGAASIPLSMSEAHEYIGSRW
ncbi:MAG: transporter substrate-binding domain-containing protein [Desulfobacteraceae bacterium]|nr:transporter substrate-binding domain-containing protein [Desulfobacteraceae bacterium]